MRHVDRDPAAGCWGEHAGGEHARPEPCGLAEDASHEGLADFAAKARVLEPDGACAPVGVVECKESPGEEAECSDPCRFPPEERAAFVPALPERACAQQHPGQDDEDADSKRLEDPVAGIRDGGLNVHQEEDGDERGRRCEDTENFGLIQPVKRKLALPLSRARNTGPRAGTCRHGFPRPPAAGPPRAHNGRDPLLR